MCKSYHDHESRRVTSCRPDTYTHFSESGRMAPNCILLRATSKGYLKPEKVQRQPRCQPTAWVRTPRHLRYRLSDGTGHAAAEQVHVGFQDQDIGVVWRRVTQELWEMFEAKALQRTEGEEWESWRVEVEESDVSQSLILSLCTGQPGSIVS